MTALPEGRDHCNEQVSRALITLIDVMRRCDPEYCAAHNCHQTTDSEWDIAIEIGEDVIEQLTTTDDQRDLFGEVAT